MTDNQTARRRGRPPKNNETSPQKLQILADTERAWELRNKERKTYREIASALGVSVSTAYSYINSKTEQIESRTDIDRKEYQAMQLDEIERAIELLWKQINVLNSVNKDNRDIGANVQLARARADSIRALNMLLDRQAKLLGLDAPTKIHNTDDTPNTVVLNIVGHNDKAD